MLLGFSLHRPRSIFDFVTISNQVTLLAEKDENVAVKNSYPAHSRV